MSTSSSPRSTCELGCVYDRQAVLRPPSPTPSNTNSCRRDLEATMSTPTPMKHAPSQQGRTPSQLAAATPPVSTPFSNPAYAAFSPRGPRSSPQHVKKSPATSTLMGQQSNGALNFDSPSTAAAMRALDMGSGFDLGLDNVGAGGLGGFGNAFSGEDDKVKRLDTILELLNASLPGIYRDS